MEFKTTKRSPIFEDANGILYGKIPQYDAIRNLASLREIVRDDKGDLLYQHEGDTICLINTQFIMLKDGEIIFSGTDESLRVSNDPYIKKFLS